MRLQIISTFLVVLLLEQNATARIGTSYGKGNVLDTNERPIIGILSVPTPAGLQKQYKWAQSFLPSSYVKFAEMAGARVVPVLIDREEIYYKNVVSCVNGIIFPGGGVSATGSEYSTAASTIFKLAVQANDAKDHFPIWATCLGFEVLSILLSPKQTSTLVSCSAQDIALPLELSANYSQSRMFKTPAQDVVNSLKTQKVTYNHHGKCVTPDIVAKSGLNGVINVLSTNKDTDGLEFVSTFESIKYPFYAVQWHPEKNTFEWNSDKLKNIPHTDQATRVTQYFANFFVSEARQSGHMFPNEDFEDKALINNFRTYFTVKADTDFTEVYLFHNTSKHLYW